MKLRHLCSRVTISHLSTRIKLGVKMSLFGHAQLGPEWPRRTWVASVQTFIQHIHTKLSHDCLRHIEQGSWSTPSRGQGTWWSTVHIKISRSCSAHTDALLPRCGSLWSCSAPPTYSQAKQNGPGGHQQTIESGYVTGRHQMQKVGRLQPHLTGFRPPLRHPECGSRPQHPTGCTTQLQVSAGISL